MKYKPDPPKIFTGNSIRSSPVVVSVITRDILRLKILSSPAQMPPAGVG